VHGCLEVAVSRHFEQLPDVDHEGTVERRRVNPRTVLLDLQPALAGFDEQKGQHAGILVRADTLPRGRV